MKAVISRTPGELGLEEVQAPRPDTGEVVVHVHAAALNPVDAQTLDGLYHDLGMITQPDGVGLGWDAAGVVLEVGAGVSEVTPGDRVALLSHGVDKALGALAQQVVVPVGAVAILPEGLPFDMAATVPLNGLTAWQAVDRLGEPDGRVLVTGAAGAVGALACVFAKERGWEVVGLARPGDEEFVRSLGVDFAPQLGDGPVDAALDAAVLPERVLEVVRDGGRYVGVIPPAVPEPRRGITPTAVFVQPDQIVLQRLVDRAAAGELPLRIAARFPFDDIVAAMRMARVSGLRGRVVLSVD